MTPKEHVWIPTAPDDAPNPFDIVIEPLPTDSYLTVDDLDEGRVYLVSSPWPVVDSSGWLSFPTTRVNEDGPLADPAESQLTLDASALHQQVSQDRAQHHQLGSDRPLRVGDTFWFRGAVRVTGDGFHKLDGSLIDVTYAARAEAKAALGWAIGGQPEDVSVLRHGLHTVEEEPTIPPDPNPPSVPGSVANPSV
jgi:hypothetical protein